MSHLYYIIEPDGGIFPAHEYYERKNFNPELKILIAREALKLPPESVEVEASNHLKNAARLGFSWEDNAGKGFINYDYKANLMIRLVKNYARELVQNIGFPIYEVKGSNFFDLNHPVVQAYAGLFGERLFEFSQGNNAYVMSYDASYPQFNLAAKLKLQAKNLPFAHFSLSDCYRYEQSGECMLLFRNRRFFMPDLHPYLKDVAEAFAWYEQIEREILRAGDLIGRKYWNVIKVSSDKFWLEYRDEIINIVKRRNQPALVEVRQEDVERYWIIDVDYAFIDQFAQVREVGCIQIDIGNAKRLGISYRDNSGKQQYPAIIHSAVPGGIERYVYAMLDNYPNHLPFVFRPVQLRLIPVSIKYLDIAEKIASQYKNRIRIEIDDRNISVAKRVKFSFADLVGEAMVIGEDEKIDINRVYQKLDEYVNANQAIPFVAIGWPQLLSRKIK